MTKSYRKGPIGAMTDEYERAVGELVRIIEGLSDEEYERVRDTETKDESCRSIQTIMTHVIGAGYGYAGMYRDAWGMERLPRWTETVPRADVSPKLQEMLGYTISTLDGRWDMPEDEFSAMRIQSRWGQVYDFEQLFEHAIVHILRHRRQIDRFLARA